MAMARALVAALVGVAAAAQEEPTTTFSLVDTNERGNVGRVEIVRGGVAGSVCDDLFDDATAGVLCRQLGLGTSGTAYTHRGGPSKMWLDDVHCQGTESSIVDCAHRDWGSNNCNSLVESVGVRCFNDTPPVFRLVGGEDSTEGRIEVVYQGQAGSVCDDSFDSVAAGVMCRQLGLGSEGTSYTAPGGPIKIWLDDVECRGNESSIGDCPHRSWGSNNCSPLEAVGVRCFNSGAPIFRLVDGDDAFSGRVQVEFRGENGTICDDHFNERAAGVLCRQLGLGDEGSAFTKPGGLDRIWLDDVQCQGNESSIANCAHREFGENNCNRLVESVGVRCRNASTPVFSLVGGDDPLSGRVQVDFRGEAGTVCDDSFDDNAAAVLCRQLGLGNDGTAYTARGGPSKVWLDDVTCQGNEASIANCSHRDWGSHDCNSMIESVGVRCFDGAPPVFSLVDGENATSGRVQVLYRGVNGSVCDDSFDDNAATVLCREMGLGTEGVAFTAGGEANTKIWLDDVSCVGNESSIADCEHRQWGSNNCNSARESVSVRCTGPVFHLVDGNSERSGRVEILYHGETGSVCDDGFNHVAATVLCRQMRLGFAGFAYTHRGGPNMMWLDDIDCQGNESSILECGHNEWGRHNCDVQSESVGVRCAATPPSFRLVSGENSQSGRIVVNMFGEDGSVCDDGFTDEAAGVVCRQLGLGHFGVAYTHGGGPSRTWMDSVTCTGSEHSLEACNHDEWGVSDCSPAESVGVRCYNATPDSIRLVDGDSPNSGRVEVTHNGEARAVCDDFFNNIAAGVLCRELGLGLTGTAYTIWESGLARYWLDDVQCQGSESSITECRHSAWGVHNCKRSENVGVICEGDFQTRLVDGADRFSGRLEVFHEGTWGAVCDDGFDHAAARVVCRSLGLGDAGSATTLSLTSPVDKFWLDDVDCNGEERNLAECGHSPWGRANCNKLREVIGVNCTQAAATSAVNHESKNTLVVGASAVGLVLAALVAMFVRRRGRHTVITTRLVEEGSTPSV